MEQQGPMNGAFDFFYPDSRAGKDSFEMGEQAIEERASLLAISKAGLLLENIDLFISGDLLNQITSSGFTARNLGLPYLGIFGACSTSMQGLILASFFVSCGYAKYALASTVSHNCTAEKQFRYPNEYGCQKPPYAQYTATAAGSAVVGLAKPGSQIKVVCGTVGKVVDLGVTDPFQMGAAMAPAATDTILTHLKDRQVEANYYDAIVTGDLGFVGREICWDLLSRSGFVYEKERFYDCGCLLYGKNPKVFSGGSGCGCCASIAYGHFCKLLMEKKLKRILVVATGALLSPLSSQQKESIPAISYAVALEGVDA